MYVYVLRNCQLRLCTCAFSCVCLGVFVCVCVRVRVCVLRCQLRLWLCIRVCAEMHTHTHAQYMCVPRLCGRARTNILKCCRLLYPRRGFGTVRFATQEDAQMACKAMTNTQVGPRPV